MLQKVLKRSGIFNCFKEIIHRQKLAMSTNVEPAVAETPGVNNSKRLLNDVENIEDPLSKKTKVEEETPAQETPAPKIKKKNYAIMLSYLGKNYYGMQRNYTQIATLKTIEGDLFDAFLKSGLITEEGYTTPHTISFQRSSRTDKGVSAARQVVSCKLPEHATKEMINEHLPEVIKCFGMERVTKGFNCKNQCDARTYRYTMPTFAFSPESDECKELLKIDTADERIPERYDVLKTIDGKPYTEFKIPQDLKEKVTALWKTYEGTHTFHNFTKRVLPLDPRGKRYIMECRVTEPFLVKGMEFISFEIKGQSFMLHQIRKMVSLVIGISRGIIDESVFEKVFSTEKVRIPTAPSLGLFLDRIHYEYYDNKFGTDGIHEPLNWKKAEADVEAFVEKYIFNHIFETEITEQSMFQWVAGIHPLSYMTRPGEADAGDEEFERYVKRRQGIQDEIIDE